MTEPISRAQLLQARAAILILVGLVVLGAIFYGFSVENLDRLWRDILERPGGPMTFRFILQPAMAIIAALRDGVGDARVGRKPYFWALVRGAPEGRGGLLWGGIVSTARIIILGVLMDIIYQWKVLGTFYPGQAAVIAILLAFIPYLLLRGPFGRIARHWVAPSALN